MAENDEEKEYLTLRPENSYFSKIAYDNFQDYETEAGKLHLASGKDDSGSFIRCWRVIEGVDLKELEFLKKVGFSRVIRQLKGCRKPLVGHNCFLDMAFMFQKFVLPLPESAAEWKAQINGLDNCNSSLSNIFLS